MRIGACIIYICFSFSLLAQSNEGREFWFSFMEHVDSKQNSMVVMITSRFNTKGVVKMDGIGWSSPFTLTANDVTIVKVPVDAENVGSEVIQKLGVKVESALPVSVYIHQYSNLRSDASLVLPIEALSTEYYTLNYQGFNNMGRTYPSEFIIVGTENGTKVDISPSSNTTRGIRKGQTISIVINEGETYLVQAEGTSDLTGSHIVSDKKVAVLSGNAWTEIPQGCPNWDNLLEMMPPVNTWGRRYISTPTRLRFELLRIIASENNTVVSIAGSQNNQVTINKGQYYEFNATEAYFINADKPILVGKFFPGRSCSSTNANGDPAMLVLNSIEQTRDSVVLYNSSFQAIEENYISVIMLTSDIDYVTLDGAPIATFGSPTKVGGNPKYAYINVQVASGSHQIFSRGCGVIAYAYGFGFAESYAYGGGASFKDINNNPIIDGGCLGAELNFTENIDTIRFDFQWDFGDGTITDDESFKKVYADTGFYKVNLVLEDKCLDESREYKKDILISSRKLLDISPPQESCLGEEVVLEASDIEDAIFTWKGPNDFFSNDQNPKITKIQMENDGEYSVFGSYFGCLSFPSTTNLTVLPLPKPDLGKDVYFCPREGGFELDPGPFVSYEWSDKSKMRQYFVDKEGSYFVTVEGENGCLRADSVLVINVCQPFVMMPNVFKLNAIDGLNMKIRPVTQDVLSGQLLIYDRWGNEIYKTDQDGEGWDGKLNGRNCLEGVYVFLYQYQGLDEVGSIKQYQKTGSFTLLH